MYGNGISYAEEIKLDNSMEPTSHNEYVLPVDKFVTYEESDLEWMLPLMKLPRKEFSLGPILDCSGKRIEKEIFDKILGREYAYVSDMMGDVKKV